MFTQKISMDCTKEQYEKYLKDELLKMGYKEIEIDGSYWADYFVIVNNFGELGQVTQLTNANKNANNRTYLGSFNAPLFLALAAMTDSPTGSYREYFTNGGGFIVYPFALNFTGYFRKATKDEIISLFGAPKISKINYEVSINAKEIISDISKALGATETAEINAINLLKSKGYKILKPKTWEEI